MSSAIHNIFSDAQLEYLIHHPNVVNAKNNIECSVNRTQGVVYFKIPLTEDIQSSLSAHFGIDFTCVSEIPMRWIKGDTAPHIDSGSSKFNTTYLAYLTDSAGAFIIDNESYDITSNTAYIFNEGVIHKTEGTGTTARLLLGPMNEFAQSVGAAIYYYTNYADAFAQNGSFIASQGNDFVLGNIGGGFGSIGTYTSWRVAYVYGSSAPTGVYSNGFDLATLGLNASFYVYPSAPCFLEGTQVLCSVNNVETYIPIELLTPGVLVKTSRNGFKKIELIGKGELRNSGDTERIENRLYKCSPEVYPELTQPLFITGCHSILVDTLTEDERKKITKSLGKIFVTDNKYRLIACVDQRAEPWASEGTYPIWNLALEHENVRMNYGIYVNGGLLVETCCLNTLKNKSNMNLV
jgi:hypothetical protein